MIRNKQQKLRKYETVLEVLPPGVRTAVDKKGRLDAVVWRPGAHFLASGRPTRVKTPPQRILTRFFIPKPIN